MTTGQNDVWMRSLLGVRLDGDRAPKPSVLVMLTHNRFLFFTICIFRLLRPNQPTKTLVAVALNNRADVVSPLAGQFQVTPLAGQKIDIVKTHVYLTDLKDISCSMSNWTVPTWSSTPKRPKLSKYKRQPVCEIEELLVSIH